MKKYLYKGKEYYSENDLRQDIWKQDRKVFSKTPKENPDVFWGGLGVTCLDEEEPLDVLKQKKSTLIKKSFLNWRNNQATLFSSLGFKVDSNERANTDVSGLLVAYEDNKEALITFRDADNEFHALSYAQVKTLQKEIIENGNHAYAQKWMLDAQVESATTKEELDVIEVRFEGKNFLKE